MTEPTGPLPPPSVPPSARGATGRARQTYFALLALGVVLGLWSLGAGHDFFALGLGMLSGWVYFKLFPPRLTPLTQRKIDRFRSMTRGRVSLQILVFLIVLACFGELFVSNRALVVSYDGELRFPVFSALEFGEDYGLEGQDGLFPVNYRALKAQFAAADDGNWVIMPLIPYGPNEISFVAPNYPPAAPVPLKGHLLGTDDSGRDVLARLFYGFRISIFFSLVFMCGVFLIGISIGCAMGYFAGKVDLIGQRLVEIWANMPFLYIVIIIYSLLPPGDALQRISVLLIVMVAFSWTGMTYFMRTGTYREKARDYVAAAQTLGASNFRVLFKHVLPNTIATIVTFIPFIVAQAIIAVTALDFLGFGLPPPTPSWGELLKQGREHMVNAPWIITSTFCVMVFVLTLITFVGEAVREAFDPKKFTTYA